MKTSYIVTGIVIVLIIGGVILYKSQYSGSPSAYQDSSPSLGQPDQTQPQSSDNSTTTISASTTITTPSSPTPQSFTVNGNDSSADLETITVPAGTVVTITFGADAGTTYHGGLDFRSSVINTGTIAPGMTKTVTFTASQSFAFTPYWPSTNVAKPYRINIIVQ